jgi:hypothetical protein
MPLRKATESDWPIPLKANQGLPLRRLLGNLILQIIDDVFAGLDSLIHLLGVFIAHKDAEKKTDND